MEKALSLAKRTGGTVMVVERHDPRAGYAVMDMEQYERFIDNNCGDRECDCKRTDDFDDWEDDFSADYDMNEDEDNYDDNPEEYSDNLPEVSEEEALFDDSQFFSGTELDNTENYGKISDTSQKNRWAIAREIKQVGGEKTAEKGAEDDRYYLESI